MEALAGLSFVFGIVFFLLWVFIIVEIFYMRSRLGRIAKNTDPMLSLIESQLGVKKYVPRPLSKTRSQTPGVSPRNGSQTLSLYILLCSLYLTRSQTLTYFECVIYKDSAQARISVHKLFPSSCNFQPATP